MFSTQLIIFQQLIYLTDLNLEAITFGNFLDFQQSILAQLIFVVLNEICIIILFAKMKG